jgi:ATP-dependent Clp protease ATP-binding subunit ClpX
MSGISTHEQVFCSFCGKSQHEVRSLIEGGCRNPALSQCVFICDGCVAFSAQVIADTQRQTSSLGLTRR